MIYPAFLCLSAVGVVVMFVTYLIPKLMDLLESTGGSLPGGARFIIGLSESFKSTWGFWLGLIVGLILFCSWFARHRSLEWDKFLMASPLLGKVLHLRQQVLFLETMSSLLENGLPIVNALSLTRNAIPRVQDGEGLSNSLVHSSCFPTILTDLISVGEETGDLSGAMERASVRFEADLKRNVERISAIIQPTVVIVMAVMVGFMAYLMISAIFQTVSGLGA
jgi:type II secretory pathway component PulF